MRSLGVLSLLVVVVLGWRQFIVGGANGSALVLVVLGRLVGVVGRDDLADDAGDDLVLRAAVQAGGAWARRSFRSRERGGWRTRGEAAG